MKVALQGKADSPPASMDCKARAPTRAPFWNDAVEGREPNLCRERSGARDGRPPSCRSEEGMAMATLSSTPLASSLDQAMAVMPSRDDELAVLDLDIAAEESGSPIRPLSLRCWRQPASVRSWPMRSWARWNNA